VARPSQRLGGRLRDHTARLNQASAALGPKTSNANIAKQRKSFNSFARPLSNGIEKRFDGANLPRCGSHF